MLSSFTRLATAAIAVASLASSANAGLSPFRGRAVNFKWAMPKQTAAPSLGDDIMGQLALPHEAGLPAVTAVVDAPAPTTPAKLPIVLEKRDNFQTCAYVSGISSVPLYCNDDEICVYNSIYSVVGCCPSTDTRCPIMTTCLARSQTQYYDGANQTQVCSDATYSECATHIFESGDLSGYTLLGCAKTHTTDGVYQEPITSTSSSDSSSSDSSSSSSSSESSSTSSSSSSSSSSSTSSTSSTSASSPTSAGASSSHTSSATGTKKSSHTGAIAGGVVGGVVGLALIGLLAFFLLRRRSRANAASGAGGPTAAAGPAAGAAVAGGPNAPAGSPAPLSPYAQQNPPPMQQAYGTPSPSPGYNPYGQQPYSPISTQYGASVSPATPYAPAAAAAPAAAGAPVPVPTPTPKPGMDYHSGPVPSTLAELPSGQVNEPRELA